MERKFWLQKIEKLWQERSIIWLSGVRRAGKTFLSQAVPGVEYFDCELPSARRRMEDPESFLEGLKGRRLVLDEIHRLSNPSELLKIAADHYPSIQILATGSSSLGASTKFRDTLTGRKRELWLTPMNLEDLDCFGNTNLQHRLMYGGLPPFFLSKRIPEKDFQDWMDAYWAKDIQELFRLERHYSFQKFLELLFCQSGGIFEANKFAIPCEVSRPTINNYLKVAEATYVAHIIRPFSSRRSTEIVSAPKVYAFDTGFICYYHGWNELHAEELGLLWEHLVLNQLYAHTQRREVRYWRDKQGHEIDFILLQRGGVLIAVEVKWSCNNFDLSNMKIFLNQYPKAQCFVVSTDIKQSFIRKIEGIPVEFCSLTELIEKIP